MDANATGSDPIKHHITQTSHQPFTITIVATTCKADKQDKPHNDSTTPSFSASAGKGGGGKNAGDRKTAVNFEEKVKVETADLQVTELLGSVTTHNCPGTRTSARVIQKMKQDQIRPTTPPPSERDHKKEEKCVQKTPSQLRGNKPTWTNLERNHFFDALNEFGKDFESIGNYINAKLKRKSSTDVAFKTKDQVRQHYYQTYHKICKYIKFSDEVKKPAQELYALINYGEIRRKLQFVTDKHFMKLKNLVYQGHIAVRCKGKNIRIKTPSCKALRRLNQLDDSLEDIRLPSKIEVIVSPANMDSFGRVQSVAQNPRARTTVPLHKKLTNFIKTFQYKWRSMDMKLSEEEAKLFPPQTLLEQNLADPLLERTIAQSASFQDPEMCFLPKPAVTIHRPLLSITEYLGSVNICLTAYEERMGVKVRGETLSQDRHTNKRQRTESGSDKRSPDAKKHKQINSPPHDKSDPVIANGSGEAVAIKEEHITNQDVAEVLLQPPAKCESSGDELSDEINDLLSDSASASLKDELMVASEECKNDTSITSTASTTPTTTTSTTPQQQTARAKRGGAASNAKTARSSLTFKPLISDDVLRRIRKGWTISNAADITIGDLYVVLGQDSKLELEYYWTDAPTTNTNTTEAALVAATAESSPTGIFTQKNGMRMPYNPSECDDPNLMRSLSTSTVGNKLKHLLLIANLSERIRKRQCSCERNAAKTRIERDLAAKTFVSNKTFASNGGGSSGGLEGNSGLFRQPIAPIRRPLFNMDPVKQLTTLSRQKMSRHVLVQRLLLPGGGSNHTYDMLDGKNFHQHPVAPVSPSLPQVSSTSRIAATSLAINDLSTNATAVSSSSHSSNSPPPPDTCNFATTVDATSTTFALPSFNNAQSNDLDQESANNQMTAQHSEDLCLPSSLPDSAFDDYSNASSFNGMSPMNLLRDSTSNSRWLEENLNDFSLTSLLGHLDEINASRDILDPSSNLSVISESSVDYMHKFQEITALMRSQDKD